MAQQKRNVQVRGQRRKEPDLRRLARAVIELAQAAAERDAQAEHERAAEQARPKRAS